MENIVYISIIVVQSLLWFAMFIVPMFFALCNRRYKAAFTVLALVIVIVVSAYLSLVLGGVYPNAEESSLILKVLSGIFAVIWIVSTFISWWYVYKRKSLDFIYIKGYTADELEEIISPEFRKILKLPPKEIKKKPLLKK